MINNKPLSTAAQHELTFTFVNRGNLGHCKIGDQLISSHDGHDTDPVVVPYSQIQDLSGLVYVYIDGIASGESYHTENINVTYWGPSRFSYKLEGYIIDHSRSSYVAV